MRWLAAAIVAVIGVAGLVYVAAGGWGVYTRDAYRALDAPEANLPRDAAERERLLLALAGTESDPPDGLPPGPRLHKPGTLALLKYETFDEQGRPLDQWQVRALVPALPALGDVRDEQAPLAPPGGCPDECRAELQRAGGLLLSRSGEPGIAAEWVLRLPLGRTFDLGARSLVTQDLLEAAPRRVPIVFRREGGRSVAEPANIRVTLLEACAADARVGTLTRLDYFPYAIVPVPRGFRTWRWVQINGCGTPAPFSPRSTEPFSPRSTEPFSPRSTELQLGSEKDPDGLTADGGAVSLHRDSGTGFSVLQVDESWFARDPRTVFFRLRAICRFDTAADRWQTVPWHLLGMPTPLEPLAERAAARVLVHLPREIGLFWVQWTESRAAAGVAVHREAMVTSGPILCNDLDIVAPPEGSVIACVPFPDRAQARYVPKPVAGSCGS